MSTPREYFRPPILWRPGIKIGEGCCAWCGDIKPADFLRLSDQPIGVKQQSICLKCRAEGLLDHTYAKHCGS